MVITGLTRNQLYLTVPWVRIPLAPPSRACNQADYRLFPFSETGNSVLFHFFGEKIIRSPQHQSIPTGFRSRRPPVKLSELSFLHRLEPPLSVLNPHFCGGFCLLPLIRIVPAPESHHGVSLLRRARSFLGKSWRHLPEAYPLEAAIQFSRCTGRQSPQ